MAALAVAFWPASPAVVGSHPLVGQPAPGFTLTTLDGRQVSLAEYRGRPVVVNFWASYCEPCKIEFPLFKAARDRHAAAGLEDPRGHQVG